MSQYSVLRHLYVQTFLDAIGLVDAMQCSGAKHLLQYCMLTLRRSSLTKQSGDTRQPETQSVMTYAVDTAAFGVCRRTASRTMLRVGICSDRGNVYRLYMDVWDTTSTGSRRPRHIVADMMYINRVD